MAIIKQAVDKINLDSLKGEVFTPAYIPTEIIEKNVAVTIVEGSFNKEFHYTFSKDKQKHTRALTVPSGVTDGDKMIVVLAQCDKEVTGKTKGGVDWTIAAGDQKLLLKPNDFKL